MSEIREKIKVLLLTHRDSDNLGDQFIEACDYAILVTIMKNLGLTEDEYELISEKAAIVTPEYAKTRNPDLLKRARKLIKDSDLVILGGAPQFNYLYQYFSERSVILIKLAQKYNKPIIFSSVGIEDYNPEHPKCKSLKRALAYDCVKMVTTRDNLPDLKRLKTREEMIIDQVADPAVFSGQVFKNFHSPKPEKKKIGLFLIRSGAFTDNNIGFTHDDITKMWLDIIDEIEKRGYDYEFVTSGHYSDEAFMDHLVRDCKVKRSKCVFNMYKPEQMIERISSYSGVISCRLHPGILSYSLKVPSVGIVWNPKVPGFYNAINYPERVIYNNEISAKYIMDKLDNAMIEGVNHDKEFITSVYNRLFYAIRDEFYPESHAKVWDYEKIMNELPAYEGTSEQEAEEKLIRKTRRCYNNYNSREADLRKLKQKMAYDLEQTPIKIRYFSKGGDELQCLYNEKNGIEETFKNGGHEYTAPSMKFRNNGKDKIHKMQYIREGYVFKGWNIRIRSGKTWFWYMNNNMLCSQGDVVSEEFEAAKYLLSDEAVIPKLQLKYIDSIVLEACWEKK